MTAIPIPALLYGDATVLPIAKVFAGAALLACPPATLIFATSLPALQRGEVMGHLDHPLGIMQGGAFGDLGHMAKRAAQLKPMHEELECELREQHGSWLPGIYKAIDPDDPETVIARYVSGVLAWGPWMAYDALFDANASFGHTGVQQYNQFAGPAMEAFWTNPALAHRDSTVPWLINTLLNRGHALPAARDVLHRQVLPKIKNMQLPSWLSPAWVEMIVTALLPANVTIGLELTASEGDWQTNHELVYSEVIPEIRRERGDHPKSTWYTQAFLDRFSSAL